MAGPLIRVLAQLAVMSIGVVSKAFMQAYAQAAANPNALKEPLKRAASSMTVVEARQILNLEGKEVLTKTQILAQFEKYLEANDTEHGNSTYLQAKVFNAKEALMEEFGYEDDEDEGEDGETETEAEAGAEAEGEDGPRVEKDGAVVDEQEIDETEKRNR